MTTLSVPTESKRELDGRMTEYFDLPHDEASLWRLFQALFGEHIREITFGPCIEGAVFEIQMEEPANLTMMDGYLTADFGKWHLHLCIGKHRGTAGSPAPEALAAHRQVSRAALYRSRGRSCVPVSWGLRLWNGHGEQMITVFLPNPFLDENECVTRDPDWSRLALWDRIRKEYLGLDPDPADRQRAPV